MEQESLVEDVSIPSLVSSLQSGKADKDAAAFIESAESYNATLKGHKDVVQEYLLHSGQCLELLEFIDFQSKKSPMEITLAFKMLEQILLRIADDLHAYESTGSYVVQSIMSSNSKTKTVYWMLSQNKSNPVKATLCLLTSMVMLGNQAAKEILSYFNFSHSAIKPLLGRTDVKSSQDIRTCYIRFILAFLVTDDNQIIRQVVDQKGLLNAIFHNVKNDKADTIQLFLSTLLSKVVQNASLSKTSKVRLLNDFSLKQVLELYCWKPPKGFSAKSKNSSSKDEKKETTLVNISQGEHEADLSDEQVEVREMAHQFLLAVCCSRKQGILFYDASFGTSGKNLNHMIFNLLTAVDKPHDSPYMRDLVSSVLSASPDQLRFYLPTLQHSVAPRLSSQWIAAMQFVQEIYKKQTPVQALKGLSEKVPVNKLVTMVSIMTIPAVASQTVFTESLNHESLVVRHVALEALMNTLKRVSHFVQPSVTSELVNIKALSSGDIPEFISRLSRSINKILPDWNLIKACWTRAVSGLHSLPSIDKVKVSEHNLPDVSVLADLPNVTLTAHLLLVVEVQLSLCHLLPDLKDNLALDMPQLLTTLQEATKVAETASEVDAFHVKVALLVVKSDELRSFLFTEKLGPALVHGLSRAVCQTSDAAVTVEAQRVLLKVLCELGLGDFSEELHIWVFCLARESSAYQCFSRIIDNFLKNKEYFSQQIEKSQSSSFSPLVVAAVETLNELSPFDKNNAFIYAVLTSILHIQKDCKGLLQFLLPYHSCLPKRLLRYFDVCVGEKKPSKRKTPCLDTSMLEGLLQSVFELRHEEVLQVDVEHMKHLVSCLSQDDLRISVYQCLFYLQLTISGKEQLLRKEVVKFYCKTLLELVKREVEISSAVDENGESVDLVEPLLRPVYSVVLRHPVLLQSFCGDSNTTKINRHTIRLVSDIFTLEKERGLFPKDLQELLKVYCQQLLLILSKQFKTTGSGLLDTVKIDSKILDIFKDQFTAAELISLLESSTSETAIRGSKVYHFCLEMAVDFVLRDRIPYISGEWLGQNVSSLLDDEKSLFIVLRLLNTYPMYASVLPCDLVNHCFTLSLDQNSSLLSDIVGIAIAVSSNHLQRFKECSLTIEVTAQSLPLLLPLATAFTEAVCCSKEDPNNQLCTDETLTVVENIFQIYFSYTIKVLQEVDAEIGSKVIQGCCRLMLLWIRLGSMDADSIVKLLLKDDSQVWSHVLIHGGNEFVSVLKQLVPSVKKLSRLTHISLYVLSELHGSSPQANATILMDLVGLCIACTKTLETSNPQKILCRKNTVVSWDYLAKQLLKNGLSNEEHIDCLELLTIVYSKFYSSDDNGLGLSVTDLHTLILSHSNFLNIMLPSDKQNLKQKGKLLDLLLAITSVDPSICRTIHVAFLLGSYGATLKSNVSFHSMLVCLVSSGVCQSFADQKLLQLLYLYEAQGCKVSNYRPYIWGPAAVTHYAIKTKMGATLHKESRMEDVLALLDKDKLIDTAMNFPLDLSLKPAYVDVENSDLYDPRFLLPLVSQLLQPEVLIHCVRFLDSGLLSLAFASLSSNCSTMRSAGYHVLYLFWEQLEGSRFANKKIWIHLLECLKNGVTEPNAKLYSMITAFLVRVSTLLLSTDDPLYAPVCAFLIRKPALDVKHIPEFLKLFNSSDLQYRKHRQWILDLVIDGLRQTGDFYLCEKAYAFKMILAYSISPLSDENSLLLVLKLCCAAAKIPSKASRLVQQHGILSYLHSLWFKRSSNITKVATSSIMLVNILWKSLLTDGTDDKGAYVVKGSEELPVAVNHNKSSHFAHNIPFVFVAEFFVTLQALLDHLSNTDINSWTLYLETLSSVSHHIHTHKELTQGKSVLSSAPRLTDHQVLTLLALHNKICPQDLFLTTDESKASKNDVTEICCDRSVNNKIQHCSTLKPKETPVSCEVHLMHVLIYWWEQRTQQLPNGHHKQGSKASAMGTKVAEGTVSAQSQVVQYVLQHLHCESQNVPLYVMLLKCLAKELDNISCNAATIHALVGSSHSAKNLVRLFDIYNCYAQCTSSEHVEAEQMRSQRTLVTAMVNAVFLQLFHCVTGKLNSGSISSANFESGLKILQPILTSKVGKRTLEEMTDLHQSLDDSDIGTVTLQISQFVTDVILRRMPQQSQKGKKRRHSGSYETTKRKRR